MFPFYVIIKVSKEMDGGLWCFVVLQQQCLEWKRSLVKK